jgi:membrane fusion protein, multidrug efflux system
MKLLRLLFCFLILISLGACKGKEAGPAGPGGPGKPGPGGPGGPPAGPIPVDYQIISAQVLENTLYSTGNLVANEQVEIRPERSGRMTKLLFREGSLVQKGALLAELDREELEAQLAKLKVNESYAERELKRAKDLLAIDGIAQEDYDRIALSLDQTRADIRLTQVALDKTRIRAPFSGKLGLRQLSEGAYISPSDVLVKLQQTDPIKLEFEVPERSVRDVRTGQRVSFTVEGLSQTFIAEVYAISNEVASGTRTLSVRARCSNSRGLLQPGNFAKVKLTTSQNRAAVLVPTDAVIPVLNGQQVLLMKGGKVLAQDVVAGQRLETSIAIMEGLAPGDTIILSGLLALKPGMPVKAEKRIESLQSSGL